MIIINDKYAITSDSNGYALCKRSKKEGKETNIAFKYSGTLDGIISVVMKQLVLDEVSTEEKLSLMDVKKRIESVEEFVKDQFKLTNGKTV